MSLAECPRCGSPANQQEGGVQICTHPFHGSPKTEKPPADLVARYQDLKQRVEAEKRRQSKGDSNVICERCGADLVEVDNPIRKEFRHRRGTECTPMEDSAHGATDGAYLPTGPESQEPLQFLAFDGAYPGQVGIVADAKGREVSRWADSAMFRSEPMPTTGGKVVPKAYLLNATPDPLGSLAALNAIYTGEVVRSLSQVTDPERREALTEVRKNKLQGPLEVINFHFLLEGVSRAFTHQIVRGRHAFYAQESLRFAVVEGEQWMDRVARPPSLEGELPFVPWDQFTPEQQALSNKRVVWNKAMNEAEWAYQDLIDAGVPAEDARGVMPHAMTTRIHWVCSLRELLYVAGVRLCTQAQFEWRTAMASVVQALREYGTEQDEAAERVHGRLFMGSDLPSDGWQFHEIAYLLRPICYQEGACGFKAKADRSCSIRERVDFRERYSLNRKDSSKWHLPLIADTVVYGSESGRPEVATVTSPGIDPAEWLADPNAAR